MQPINIGQSVSTSTPSSQAVAAQARSVLATEYASKTSAKIVSSEEFEGLKAAQGLHVVGVAGYSGQWAPAKLAADPNLKVLADAAVSALSEQLKALKSKYGEKLIISSGATMEGVPKIIYDLCVEQGVPAIGVACAKAFKYPLATMKYLVVEGQEWGEESASFISLADELVVLGGGGQAKREMIAAGQQGKDVTVFQGFGGAADQLSAAELPKATFKPALQ